jgi:hypothetical protein
MESCLRYDVNVELPGKLDRMVTVKSKVDAQELSQLANAVTGRWVGIRVHRKEPDKVLRSWLSRRFW